VVERRLSDMAAAGTAFRALCLTASSRIPFFDDDSPHARTLDALLDLFDELASSYEIVPVTLTAAHERFRRMTR
jgi:hypothetical protein